jgi:hypothetical protein
MSQRNRNTFLSATASHGFTGMVPSANQLCANCVQRGKRQTGRNRARVHEDRNARIHSWIAYQRSHTAGRLKRRHELCNRAQFRRSALSAVKDFESRRFTKRHILYDLRAVYSYYKESIGVADWWLQDRMRNYAARLGVAVEDILSFP